uniref:Uncharacterized protein n=1 Tax=Heterorhabditis bacteriophora TaxID=37862 RepID=A0A1I7WYA8_HETBA
MSLFVFTIARLHLVQWIIDPIKT